MNALVEKIASLKLQKHAVILAHIYQRPEIQDVADFVGDSLDLSRKAASTDAELIVFCGVDFMAETAKILSPTKKVLMPDPLATCPMANMITVEALRKKKLDYPSAAVVCYVNTKAEIKAESDICCTSRNAVAVVQSLSQKQIIFVPDQSLGAYVASQCPEKDFILWPGFCPTHHRILEPQIAALKQQHPTAKVAAHPECTADVLGLADFIGSTGAIQEYVQQSSSLEFIIATEEGILYPLGKENPNKTFYHPGELAVCPNMKKNTLEKVLRGLEAEENEVTVSLEIAAKARETLVKMMRIY
jgi:quinolinate synthase